jgi:hypothetical protein
MSCCTSRSGSLIGSGSSRRGAREGSSGCMRNAAILGRDLLNLRIYSSFSMSLGVMYVRWLLMPVLQVLETVKFLRSIII